LSERGAVGKVCTQQNIIGSMVGIFSSREGNSQRTALPLTNSSSAAVQQMGFGAALGAFGNPGCEVIPLQDTATLWSFNDGVY
jgi:hypothetical protein